MTLRRDLSHAAVLLFCAAITCLAQAPGHRATGKTDRRPDVFLITIDTLRADHLQCYGYKRIETPGLNSVADDGVLFTSAFTPIPLTTPSHASIFTGDLPGTHGVLDFGMPLSRSHVTMAQLLKNAGYKTAAFIASVMLDSNRFAPGLNRGFDVYNNFPRSDKNQHRQSLERPAGIVVSQVEGWLDMHPAGPRFVWMHLYDPHEPYLPPPPYARLYRGALYDGEIAYADSAVRQLLTRLKRRGLYDPALIIIVGDHGESLGEHAEKTHGIFLYDATVHVPLILKLPGQEHAGTVVKRQVRTIDILPTVLDLVSIRGHDRFDGESLRRSILTKEIGERPVFGETDYPVHFGWAPIRSIRKNGFKFIEAPRPELFNVAADPNELDNIYEVRPATARTLHEILAAEPVVSVLKRTRRMDQQSIGQLRALGYLESDRSSEISGRSTLPDAKDEIRKQK